MIIWIVQGEVQKRGTTDLQFVAACTTERQVFHVIRECKRDYKTYKATKYNTEVNKWIGGSQTIWPHQQYNHAKDGHLDPPENRDENGHCKSAGIWGPYCSECRKRLFEKFDT